MSGLLKKSERLRQRNSSSCSRSIWVLYMAIVYLQRRKKTRMYNRVNIMLFTDGTKCTIRIPAHGTATKWAQEDVFAVRLEALTMMLMERKNDVPVPEILEFNHSCDNELGDPYMVTSFMEGSSIRDVWGDKLDRNADNRV